MAETTDSCSSNEDIFAVFSHLCAGLRSLAFCSPAVSTDPEVIFFSPPTSPLTYLPNQASNDKQLGPNSTCTIETIDNDPTVKVSSTASVQFLADNSTEDQHELPLAHSFPNDCSRLHSHPNQFKHRAVTANSVHSLQHSNDSFASKPTAIIRPRINSRLRYGLKPEFNSWEVIFWDNQRNDVTIQNTVLTTQCITFPRVQVAVFALLLLVL